MDDAIIQNEIRHYIESFRFEYNDALTRTAIVSNVGQMLDGAVEVYEVVCDEFNNPPSVIDAHELVVDVSYKRIDETTATNFVVIIHP